MTDLTATRQVTILVKLQMEEQFPLGLTFILTLMHPQIGTVEGDYRMVEAIKTIDGTLRTFQPVGGHLETEQQFRTVITHPAPSKRRRKR